MSLESRWRQPSLTRRQFMQGAVVAGSALMFARTLRVARALDMPAPVGFLTDAELRVVDAFSARLVPTGDTIGAHEAGVSDYIQGLLSVFLGADVNGDGLASAADVTAVIQKLGTDDPAADVNGDGTVDAADVALTQSSIFGSVLVGTPAFAGHPLFASGPFSDRNPFPDPATGTPSTNFPPNEFLIPLQLPRVKRLAWTARLLGASAVPELAANPLATTQPDVDMRRRYREGLAQVNAYSTAQYGSTFDQLDSTQQDAIVKMVKSLDRSFYDLLINHTIEGMLSAPEYGGNSNRVVWQLTHFDGDSQPLGYTIFDTTTQMYVELPDKPNSTLDPDDQCTGFSDAMQSLLHTALVLLAGAQQFPDTPCYRG